METLSSICKKDGGYKEVVKECYVVKNAVSLLGGRRRKEGEKLRKEKEGEEGEEGEGRREEEKGGMEMVERMEMGVREKISLIELLNELVKGGMEMGEEEEMKEVLMELEEEGNKHVEAEIEGGGGEEKEEEKREWEELSERACMLVLVMEKMQNRREGKRSATFRMIRKEKEEMKEKMEEERRGREEEKKKVEEEKKKREEEKRAFEERISRMEREMEEMKKKEGGGRTSAPSNTPDITPIAHRVITSLDNLSVKFSDYDKIRREGNTIIHDIDSWDQRHCFIGGEMKSVCVC